MQLAEHIPLGARYMIMSALGFALMGVFVKIAGARGIPVLEIVAARCVVSVILSYIDVRRKGISLLGVRRGLLFARGLVGACALVCVYYSLLHLPFAEATVLQYLNPMFTALLALVFLREHLKLSTCLCVVLSFLGLLVMVSPDSLFGLQASLDSARFSLLTVGAGILGAFGSAVAYVLVRKLSKTEDPSVIIFYFPMIALPVSLLLLGDDLVIPQGSTYFVLFMVGIFTQVGQIGLTKAMQTESASSATSFSYLQVVFAMIFGLLIFGEIPTGWTITGAVLILLGAFVNVVLGKRSR